MNWRPLHSNHAIERVRLVVQFSEQVPAKILRTMSDIIASKRHDLRMTGPTPVQNFEFQIGPGGTVPVQSIKGAGWQFTRTSSNGLPLEALVCDGVTLTYETTEYQRWEVYTRRLQKLLADALAPTMKVMDAQMISLEYLDRFLFDGPASEADARTLLSSHTEAINTKAISGKSIWHLHKGWFEEFQGGQVLINQNFDAQDGIFLGGSDVRRSIQITTRAEFRAQVYDVKLEMFDQHIENLHSLTKGYFSGSIKAEHCANVGIK